MAWKTKKQRKIAKAKAKVKKIIILLLVVLVVVGVGILHNNDSKETTDATTYTETQAYMFGANNDDTDEHCFSVSIDGHILQITW